MIQVLRALAGLALIVPAAAWSTPARPHKASPPPPPALAPSEAATRVIDWVLADGKYNRDRGGCLLSCLRAGSSARRHDQTHSATN